MVKVWRRYQVYMPIPARAPPPRRRPCATRSSGKPRSPSGSRHSARPPGSDDYRIGYIKTLADARKDGEALSEARRLVAEQASVAHLQTLSMSTCGWAKAGTSCWWTRRSSIVNRKTKLRWPA